MWNKKVTVIPTVIGSLGIVTKGFAQVQEDLKIKDRVEIGKNTEKSPGDLRRLALTQTLVIDYQLTLMWKTLKE